MNLNDFRRHGHELIDWMADYFENIEQLPVKSKAKPGDIIDLLPKSAPDDPEPFEEIMKDFNRDIMPGITHWQHPGWHAYFAANSSYPSILGEMLTSALGAQCMSWVTSPAATELEERIMEWLRDMTGLPKNFTGVIQDTASTATLVSLLTARERFTDFDINKTGYYGRGVFTVYCSTEAHSSVEKAVKIAGFGKDNLRKIEVDEHFAMKPEALEAAIVHDREHGFIPLAVVAAIGTTGSTAIDPLKAIGKICSRQKIWLHVDAAWAGTAMLLSDKRYMIEGIENADTYVFNPHKWMFTNFDASAYFVKDKEALIHTFEILPEYLKTKEGTTVNNYRDWGIQLGRRFRALKLWFVIRTFGVKQMQEIIGNHIKMAEIFAEWIESSPDFELLAPAPLATVCFRFNPGLDNEEEINILNRELLEAINASEGVFLTHTTLNGKYTIRFVVGQTRTEKHHVEKAWKIVREVAERIRS